jgi:lipopolysaccharide/colanic/teichoic acid biosynthesis glycosyltransferase
MLLIAGLIKLMSRGPVFFKQERVGLNGRVFTCYKFRTMTQGASTESHQEHLKRLIQSSEPMTKLDAMGDKRVIRGAGVLRSMGLDELPQLINVVRGEMSWVGPRPSTMFEFQNYKPGQDARCATLPGLTGLWQVCGKNQTTFDEMIDMDVVYTRTKTIWLDLAIMIRTPMVLMTQLKEVLRKRTGNAAGKKIGAPASGAVIQVRVIEHGQVTVN